MENRELSNNPVHKSIKLGSFEAAVEWGLLLLGSKYGMCALDPVCNFGLKVFNGCDLLDHLAIDELKPDHEGFFRPGLVKLRDTGGELNSKIFKISSIDQENIVPISIQKWRTMNPKEYRGRQIFYAGKKLPLFCLIEESAAAFHENEKWYTVRRHFALLTPSTLDNELDVIAPVSFDPYSFYKMEKETMTEFVKERNHQWLMSLSLEFSNYYNWFAYIREDDDAVGFKIPISPGVSKEVFSMRNLPTGAKRRKAIVNFVTQHLRRIKKANIDKELSEPERMVLVRKHFRGETKFNWRGLQVNIIPAQYDQNRYRTRKKFLKIQDDDTIISQLEGHEKRQP